MRTQMAPKEKGPATNARWRSAHSNVTEVTPTSSAVIAVTLTADMQDTLAALRTAALLARSLKAALSIDVFGMETIVVGPGEDEDQAAVRETLDRVHAHLRDNMSPNRRSFVLEGNITAASFLTVGGISVRLHTGNAVEEHGRER